MSREQREALDAQLREAPLDLGGEVAEQRVVIEEMMGSTSLADDVTTSDATLGGIEAILVETPETRSDRVVLYLHGGAYALGSARVGVELASEVARRARARAYSIDYRSVDAAICDIIPIGTHFLWHLLNSVVLYLSMRAFILDRRVSLRRAGNREAPPATAAVR